MQVNTGKDSSGSSRTCNGPTDSTTSHDVTTRRLTRQNGVTGRHPVSSVNTGACALDVPAREPDSMWSWLAGLLVLAAFAALTAGALGWLAS